MKGRIDVVYEGKICWSVIERDGKYSLECDNKDFKMKELTEDEKKILIKMTVDNFFNRY